MQCTIQYMAAGTDTRLHRLVFVHVLQCLETLCSYHAPGVDTWRMGHGGGQRGGLGGGG